MSGFTEAKRLTRLETRIDILEARQSLHAQGSLKTTQSCLEMCDILESLLTRVAALETGNVYIPPADVSDHAAKPRGSASAPQNGGIPASC